MERIEGKDVHKSHFSHKKSGHMRNNSESRDEAAVNPKARIKLSRPIESGGRSRESVSKTKRKDFSHIRGN